ncbi:MAG: alpha/beta hydrolase [Chloroflexota bacterium]|nr:alpha/beta hydrolase [Chloroflexota bacterium]
MPTVRVNGIDIWFERSGGAGPILVLTHGFAGPTVGWPPIIDDFRKHFDLLLYDVRAHGNTGMPAGAATVTVPQFAADLAGLLDALDIERAHIGGVSMGGMISAQFACDHPGRVLSLSLCDTTAGNRLGPDAAANGAEAFLVNAFERMAHVVEKYGMTGLVERENRYRREGDKYAYLATTSFDQQDEKNWRTKRDAMTREGYLAANRALRERPDLTSRTAKITAPTLISCGEWDAFYPCALRDHALIANSHLVTIRGAAHATPDYQPELWKRAVFEFIDDVESGGDVRGEVVLANGQ